jgi:dipeptidyl aminopeptidase/acylaminoacyl peptidase
MSEVVDLSLFGITAPEFCTLNVFTENLVSINCLGASGNSALLTLVDTSTGTFDTYWPEMAGDVGSVLWAPDGSAFAFCMGMAEEDTGYGTWLVEVADGQPLASNATVELGVGCPQAWSPDSQRVVTNSQVFNMADPSVAEVELQAGEYTKRSRGDATLYQFSSDGTRLAYGEISSYVLDLETLDEYQYEQYGGGYFEPPPVWSADGSYLYRGSCALTAEEYQWRCGGSVFAVEDLLAGCPDDDGDWREGREPCSRRAPGANAVSAVPAPE